ncbi:MAG: amidophosphoribosyltransferase [Ectothiorhodospiraceae bacterium]|nr:amidophosphoribosyltransferase [Ectothiorhodospiraceae bacterium]
MTQTKDTKYEYVHDVLDKPRSNCAVVGVYGTPDAATLAYYALHSMQHRGQEASGIVSRLRTNGSNGKHRMRVIRGPGLVTDVFHDPKMLTDVLVGDVAIGHNRYSTTGSDNPNNVQPFLVNYRDGQLAVSHNGNMTNTRSLRSRLEEQGTIFQTSTDTEVILHLTARSEADNPEERIMDALNTLEGAYSLAIMHNDTLIAARDPHGFRPLCIGKLDDTWIVASETCALDIIGAEYVRDVEPGEVLFFDQRIDDEKQPRQRWLDKKADSYHHCIFEFIYFARPDSKIFGENVDKIRRRLGKLLAEEHPVDGTEDDPVLVMSVPDSSNTASLGYFRNSVKLGNDARYEIGLIRNHYVGRTFIQPGQDQRELKVRMKFNTVKGVIEGRKVVLIDDSIVRGTTSKLLIQLIREANPKEIHVRISSPPIVNPCPYGMDFPSRKELIAVENHENVEEIRQHIGADSLAYLSPEMLLSAVDQSGKMGYCTACFTGDYPIPPEENMRKDEHEG